MFEHADFVSWALAAVGFGYGVWVDSLARKRLDIAHAGLVSLKPSIQGWLSLQSMTSWKN